MRQWRMYNIEQAEVELDEQRALRDYLEMQLDAARSCIEDLEYEIRSYYRHEDADEERAYDDRERARDMQETLRGGEV